MKHLGTKRLETERLILRPFETTDAEKMYKNWADDDEVTRFLTWSTHTNVTVTEALLADWVSQYEKEDNYMWAIVNKDIDEPIGSISAVKVHDNIKMVQIGYCIGKKWWHQGLASEALSRLITFFFEEVGINRIEARHDINNPYSGEVMEKCGMHQEGIMKQADMNNQGICNMAVYSILSENYFFHCLPFLTTEKLG